MNLLINRNTAYFVMLILGFLLITSCGKEWEPSMTELDSDKVLFQVQANDNTGKIPMEYIKLAVYAKTRGQTDKELLFEGRADEEGRLVLPDFAVPSLVTVKVTDSRYPPVEVSTKVLNASTALVNIEVGKEWSESDIYDRSNWEAEASSQQATGPAGNILIAGNATWHSQYSPTEPDFPHWLLIDMKETKVAHGFALKNRENPNGPIKDMEIFISDHKDSGWRSVGIFQMENSAEWQLFTLDDEVRGRYVKLLFKSSYRPDRKFTNLAEFGVY